MNRNDRRASDSQARRGNVSPALLQSTLQRVEQERQAMQDLLWAIVRSQGRVRVRKQDMHGNGGERLDVREVGDDFYLSIDQTNMVTPHGVRDGKAVEPREAG